VLLGEVLDDAGGSARLLEAPSDTGHAAQDLRQAARKRLVAEGLLDEGVLENLVLDALLTELAAEARELLDRHAREVDENRRGHLRESLTDRADRELFVCTQH